WSSRYESKQRKLPDPMPTGKPHEKCEVCGRRRCCGAKIRSPGKYGDWKHHAPPMPNGKCRIHGGLTPAGPMSANYKHGLYAKFLPARFADLLAVLEGRDLLDLTDDIKLLHARLLDIAKQVDAGESGERWKEAQRQFERFAACQAQQDREGALVALTDLR